MSELVEQWKILLAEFFQTDGDTPFNKTYSGPDVIEMASKENMRSRSFLRYFGGVVSRISNNNAMDAFSDLFKKEIALRRKFIGLLELPLTW